MKRYFLLLLFIPFASFSQTLDERYAKFEIPWVDGEINYSSIITAEGKSKDDLFNLSKKWFSETFRSSKSVLEVDDREMGRLSGKAWSPVDVLVDDSGFQEFRGWYHIIIDVKDGRYRYQIKDIEFEPVKLGSSRIQANKELGKEYLFKPNGDPSLRFLSLYGALDKIVPPLEESLKNKILISGEDW